MSIQTESQNSNGGTNKIRKVLFKEISLLVVIIGFVIGIFVFITEPDSKMKQDIALIQKSIDIIENNHLKHIQEAIEKEQKRNDKQDEVLQKINLDVMEIITLIKNKN